MLTHRAVSLMVLSLTASAALGQKGLLLVAQKGDQSLAIVDPQAGKVIVSVPEGGNTGHEVTASPDGRLAYVPIYGNSGVGKPGTDGHNMVVIDLASHKVVGNWTSVMVSGRTNRFRTQGRDAVRDHGAG